MLDIVIVNYNSTNLLIICLGSIKKSLNGIDAKIFVQDNASTDGIDRIASKFPRVILTKNRRNLGFAKAVNQGLKQGTGDYVILINPDTHVIDGLFEKCLAFMRDNPDVGLIGPKILDIDGGLQNSARSFPTPLTAIFGRSSLLSKWFPKNPITSRNLLSLRSNGRTPMEVDWVSGACMMVRRKAILDTGLMDERFFMYWEDADWCRRMWQNGWKVVYFPGPSIVHYIGGSSESNILRSVTEFHKSVYRFFEKYLRPSHSFLKPMVFIGIYIRFCTVLFMQLVRKSFNIFKKRYAHKKSSAITPVTGQKGKIKILRVISRLNVGGPAIHVHQLTQGLNPEKFDSKLVAGKVSPQEGDMSYIIDPLGKKPVYVPELQREISPVADFKALVKIFKILQKDKPDIVDTHTAKAGFIARFATLIYNSFYRHNIHTVHTFHGHIFEGYFNRTNTLFYVNVERLWAKATDVIIAISDSQKRDLVEKYRIADADKIRKVELGFDLTPFINCKALKGQLRHELNISDDTLLIGIIGRLAAIKNHPMFFNAARIFLERTRKAQNSKVKVKFLVVGDGAMKRQLESDCRKQGLSDHVCFCGWLKNMAKVYADLDILALTSINEGTPFSIIEAMASRVPVIATDAGGVVDLLGHYNGLSSSSGFKVCKRGILCAKDDPSGFADGLKYLTEAGVCEREGLVNRALFFVEQKYSEKRLLHDMEMLYAGLMNGEK